MSKIYGRPAVKRLCFNDDGDLVGVGMEGGETVLIVSAELAEAVEEVYPTLIASFYTKMMRVREELPFEEAKRAALALGHAIYDE